ncbi:RES family NAD+ phosphorylase [Streptomyces hoynatensis]|uniref:RES domain-containing protein n=1 Tax=Streptomyces hoynatensis TaxID=1141874 RepID=A0A3A9ZIV3_9ACTN|nr:RES family NAD+ phosphorylase [Streptomyces hoynatensis]RKN47227.1 RES domain-containing protein [Streptomyces hoynatensis]
MPAYAPPAGLAPHCTTLEAGTRLWRCHLTPFPAAGFHARSAHPHFGGGRFDGTAEDPFKVLYVADEPLTALAEVFLRSREFGPDGGRLIPWAQARTRSLTRLVTTRPLPLIRLVDEEDLAAIGQDRWLVEEEGVSVYPQTRCWTAALRRDAPWAKGLVWQSRRRRPRLAYVLFGDRCGEDVLKAEPEVFHDLGTEAGVREANLLLAALNAAISLPEAGPWPGGR